MIDVAFAETWNRPWSNGQPHVRGDLDDGHGWRRRRGCWIRLLIVAAPGDEEDRTKNKGRKQE